MAQIKTALLEAEEIVSSLEAVCSDDAELAYRAKLIFAHNPHRNISMFGDMDVAGYFVDEVMKIREHRRVYADAE